MRVAGQEGIGAAANDAVAGPGAGASAGGAFTALLALLQGGAAPAQIEQLGAGDAILDGAPGDGADDLGAGADDAGAADGVVVTLSAASTVAAAASTASATTAAANVAPGTSDAVPGGGAAVATAIAALADEGAGVGGAGSVPAGNARAFAVAGKDAAQARGEGAAEPAITTATVPAIDETAPAAHRTPTSGPVATGGAETPAAAAVRAAARTGADGPVGAGSPDAAARAEGDGAPARGAQVLPGSTGETPIGEAAATAPAARAGAAHASAATPLHGNATTPAQRADSTDADDADETGADDALPAARGAGAATSARDLPAGVRLLGEPAHELAGPARDGAASNDATARTEGLGIARGDALAGNGAGTGAERVRASGFTAGEAGLPSWVERLSSPEGLAATRRGDALHMDLEPNGLGRIEIRLSLGRDGLRATVIAEHEHTRNLLASQQPQLAAALERNDLRLESFLVDVGAHAGGDGREAWRDATDPAAFDQIGMVHVTERDAALDDPSRASTAPRGLVSVRA